MSLIFIVLRGICTFPFYLFLSLLRLIMRLYLTLLFFGALLSEDMLFFYFAFLLFLSKSSCGHPRQTIFLSCSFIFFRVDVDPLSLVCPSYSVICDQSFLSPWHQLLWYLFVFMSGMFNFISICKTTPSENCGRGRAVPTADEFQICDKRFVS